MFSVEMLCAWSGKLEWNAARLGSVKSKLWDLAEIKEMEAAP